MPKYTTNFTDNQPTLRMMKITKKNPSFLYKSYSSVVLIVINYKINLSMYYILNVEFIVLYYHT